MFKLTGLRRKLVQLFQLVLQQLFACVALDGLLLMMSQFAAALVPALVSLLHLRQQGGLIGVGVEQLFLVLRLE
ncbi:hypothetical protein D3C80_1515020 [compost metagenome]